MPFGLFVSATGTSSGKTFLSRGLTRALSAAGQNVAALKPLETGVPLDPLTLLPAPLDALALARACRRPHLASLPGLYRAAAPLSPYAASLLTGEPTPDLDALTAVLEQAAGPDTFLLVEGAGGLLVPLDRRQTVADLALRLRLPLLLAARDELGVLSSVLTSVEAATHRGLSLTAVVLTPPSQAAPEPGLALNARILRERLPCPIFAMPFARDDDDALASAVRACGLFEHLQAL
jgi:dethiobiotin synthetase